MFMRKSRKSKTIEANSVFKTLTCKTGKSARKVLTTPRLVPQISENSKKSILQKKKSSEMSN